MSELKTTTGSTWNTEMPARSSVIKHINEKGCSVMSRLRIVKIAGTHVEFGELKTDLIVIDQFGDYHNVCEDFVIQ